MAFFDQLLTWFDEALDWPVDLFITDDDVVESWAPPPALEPSAPAIARRSAA